MGAVTQTQAPTLETSAFQLQGSKILLGCLPRGTGSMTRCSYREFLSLPIIEAELWSYLYSAAYWHMYRHVSKLHFVWYIATIWESCKLVSPVYSVKPTQCPIQCVHWFFPGLKRPGREVHHAPASSAEVKNGWSSTCLPLHSDTFTFTFIFAFYYPHDPKINKQIFLRFLDIEHAVVRFAYFWSLCNTRRLTFLLQERAAVCNLSHAEGGG